MIPKSMPTDLIHGREPVFGTDHARTLWRQQPADHAGGIIHHRDDAGVVEPGRPDHADHADDPAFAVAIGRDNRRGAGQREQLVLRPDEDADAFGSLGAATPICWTTCTR